MARWIRLSTGAAGGAKLCGRGEVNSLLSLPEMTNTEHFGKILAARLGAPDFVADASFSYSICDTDSGIEFEIYSSVSGPAYGGAPIDCFVDFKHGDNRIKPEVICILEEFEKWITHVSDE